MNRNIIPDPNIPAPQQYRKLECIGRGAYGSVHKGVFIPTGEVVALKIINLDGQDDDVEAIQKEVALLSSLRGSDSTNITRYHGCWLEGPHVWIVMDLAEGGSVRTLAKAAPNNAIEERFTAVIMREVLQALGFLHRNNVIHRDLKAANVLISSDGRVMLCDFGVSALLATPHSKRSTFVGTPQWMAPEVILGQTYDTKADIWGLGITLYEMATGAPPHADQDHMRALMLIPKLKPPKLPDATDASKEMREFLALCLREIPGDRLPVEELAKSKWIKSAKAPVSLLKDLLTRYESWTSKGGVRASLASPFGALDPDDEPQDYSQPQSWEFDTLRPGSTTDGVPSSGTMDFTPLAESTHVGDASLVSNPPRSLRMLFEDASNPGSDPFRVTVPRPAPSMPSAPSISAVGSNASLDSSASSTVSIDLNISPNLTPSDVEQRVLPVPFDSAHDVLSVRRDSTDILTARQANYVFPRSEIEASAKMDTVRASTGGPTLSGTESESSLGGGRPDASQLHKPSFSGAMGLPRSPRPPPAPESDSGPASDNTSKPGSDSGLTSPPRIPSYREVRDSKGLANISIPPTLGTSVGFVQFAESPGTGDAEPGRTSARENSDREKGRNKDVESAHEQGSGSGSSLPGVTGLNGLNSRPARERPARAKRNATVGSPTDFRFGGAPPDGGLGLVPPSAGASHGASRSLDSRSAGGVGGFGSGFTAAGNAFRGNAGGHSPGPSSGAGGLAPRPPLLGRQASAMAVLEGGGRAAGALVVPGRNGLGANAGSGGIVLKDLLKLSPVPAGSLGPGASADMLPPSPGIGSMSLSPVSRVFNPSPSGLQTSTTPTDLSAGPGNISPTNGTNGLRGYPSSGGHSQSNSYSHTNYGPASHPNSYLHPDVPDLPPLDLGALVSAEDVHAELARTVDGLMAWLGVVDAGLGEIMGAGDAEESEMGDDRSESGAGFDLDEDSAVGVVS